MIEKRTLPPTIVEMRLDDGSLVRVTTTQVVEHIPAHMAAFAPRIGEDGLRLYGGYKEQIVALFLDDLGQFLRLHPAWGEISLLKAAGVDHRFLNRVRAGEGFRVDTLDVIAAAMNRIVQGEIDPTPYRNLKKKPEAV